MTTAIQRQPSSGNRASLSRMSSRGRHQLMTEVFPQFTCICELCDCGRHKHHEDCKRKKGVKRVKPSTPCMITHYNETYKDHPGHRMRGSKRPPLTPQEGNRGPMEGQTHNMREFPVRPINMVKSCKKIEVYRPTEQPFDGDTVYKIQYPPKETKLPGLARAADHPRREIPMFDDRTMHKEQFKSWDVVKSNPQYRELPCYAGELVLPQNQKFNDLTVTKRDYPGKYMPKQEAFKMAPPQIDLMLEGDFDHNTVHNDTYYTQRLSAATRQPIINKPTSEVTLKRGKFYDVTQTKDDFQDRGKAQRFPMIPANDNIQIDKHENQFFDTSMGAEFPGYDVKHHPVPAPIIYKDSYEMPTGKVEDRTVNRVTYTPKDVRYSYNPPRPHDVKYDTSIKPRFVDKTMNKEAFKDWGTARARVRQGDLTEGPRQQYSPPQGIISDETTTRVHYPWKILSAPVKNMKPIEKYVKGDGEIDFKTINNLEYAYKRPKMCRVELYLLQMALKKRLDANLNDKTPSLTKCTKPQSAV